MTNELWMFDGSRQAKEAAGTKPKNFRIKLDQSTCKPCGNPEYACTCHE